MVCTVEFHLFHGHKLLVSRHLCPFDLASDVMEKSSFKLVSDSLLVFLSVKHSSEEFNLRDCIEREFDVCVCDAHLF